MSNSSRFFIGVDGGGTQTTAVVVDATWRVLGQGSAAGSNYHTVGIDSALAHVAAAVDGSLNAAGLGKADIAAAGFGLAGVRHPPDFERMMPRVQALGFEKFHLDHDAAAAWAGALECQPGVIVIAGTGSIAFGVNAKNERAIAGGWGWLLGDEGSGYWIGREALRTVCAMADGRRPLTPLMPAVLEHFGLSAMEQLVDYAYQQPGLSREPTAALTQVVLRCAREGDEASASIIGQAGWHLATTAGAVIDRLGVKGNGFVSYVGGVWEAHEFLMPTFSRLLKPFAHIVPPLHSSAVGAAMLARSAL